MTKNLIHEAVLNLKLEIERWENSECSEVDPFFEIIAKYQELQSLLA